MGTNTSASISDRASDLSPTQDQTIMGKSWSDLATRLHSVQKYPAASSSPPTGTFESSVGLATPSKGENAVMPLNEVMKVDGNGFSVEIDATSADGFSAGIFTIPVWQKGDSSISGIVGFQPGKGFPVTAGLSGSVVLNEGLSLGIDASKSEPNDGKLTGTTSVRLTPAIKLGDTTLSPYVERDWSRSAKATYVYGLDAKTSSKNDASLSAGISYSTDEGGQWRVSAGYWPKKNTALQLQVDLDSPSIQGMINTRF